MTSPVSRTPRPARPRATTIVAWALWAVALILVAISLATARSGGPDDLGTAITEGGAALMLVSVGAILVSRLPHHLIGWLLVFGGLVIAILGSTAGLADYGLTVHPGSVPGAIWLAWTSQWAWAPEIAILFILLPLFYPTGRLPSARWRVVVVIAAALVVIGGLGSALGPWAPDPYPVGNPLVLGGTAADLVSFFNYVVATALVMAGGALAVASLIVRYRRAVGIERAQLKWFAAAATVTGVAGAVNIGTNWSLTTAPTGALGTINAVSGFVIYVGLALLPVAIGLAVLRYKLYEIDRLISRTISYGVLTAIVAGLFVGFILVFQAVLAPVTGSNELAVAGSTLLAAALFQPIRRRVQRLVDRRFNRSRYDAERTVAAFASRLRDEVDLEQLRAEILATVTATVEPSSVSLWLRE
jgi:hypothetical protein